uniref:Poly A polymerase head domain-containing protein n=1 Tax=Arion vulgaris TaxID=1028688 RepID=A0A0B7BF51_9EUPU
MPFCTQVFSQLLNCGLQQLLMSRKTFIFTRIFINPQATNYLSFLRGFHLNKSVYPSCYYQRTSSNLPHCSTYKLYNYQHKGSCTGHCCVYLREFSKTPQSNIVRSSAEIISKPNLITMKLDSPEFHSIFTPELHFLVELFTKYGYELRIAGGAVRDLLFGKVPSDYDFATTATPPQMKEMFTAENIRMINTNGEAHGTITARINDKENFEVTTLRIDVVTDGRRAEVEFTKDWLLDSNRRDLTVNSMFLGFDGTVYDYFNGIEDLKNRRIRFVGSPEQRIQEDYLRILRYFRFFGRLAASTDTHDQATLVAIRENAQGLERVSGERIWVEVKKILTGRLTAPIIKQMIDLGLGKFIGLPRAHNFEEFDKVCGRTEEIPHHHITRMAALLDNEADVDELLRRNKISNEEVSLALFIVRHRNDKMGENVLSYCTDLHTDCTGKEVKVTDKIVELMKYHGHLKAAEDFPTMKLPLFPVTGHDLTQNEVPKGPKFASTLNELRKIWKESG